MHVEAGARLNWEGGKGRGEKEDKKERRTKEEKRCMKQGEGRKRIWDRKKEGA